MRKFRVWLCKNIMVLGDQNKTEEIIELSDDATDEECDEACKDVLDTLIANELDTGWEEI